MNTTILHSYVKQALSEARQAKEDAGRSDAGRHLSIVTTKLEEVEAVMMYYGLTDVKAIASTPPSHHDG